MRKRTVIVILGSSLVVGFLVRTVVISYFPLTNGIIEKIDMASNPSLSLRLSSEKWPSIQEMDSDLKKVEPTVKYYTLTKREIAGLFLCGVFTGSLYKPVIKPQISKLGSALGSLINDHIFKKILAKVLKDL